MIRLLQRCLIALPFLLIAPCGAESLPLLHPLFSDHAVLQRDRALPVWGWATPGRTVTVRFAGQVKQATVAADGRWTCVLDPLPASAVGRDLTVLVDGSGDRIEVRDLLLGDVWLCSGQSNMEMGITLCREDEEIAAAKDDGLRLLTIPHRIAYTPQEVFAGAWQPCSPQALRNSGWGGFSATAYFFGKQLREVLGVPVGLIHASWGGTVIEAWTSAGALQPFAEFDAGLQEVDALARSQAADPEAAYLDAWFRKHDPGSAKGWQEADADSTAWREVQLPGRWGDCGIPGFEGVVWIQRRIDLPEAWVGKPLVLRMGEISDNDTTWVNGRQVGLTNGFDVLRRYEVPVGLLHAGSNVITVRITNAGGGGVAGKAGEFCLHPVGDEAGALSLAGAWRLQETSKKADTGQPLVGNPNVPSVLYNGMIAPLRPAALTGAIWYQGEANADRALQYRRLLPALIRDWRHQFAHDGLAFHIVSLANYQPAHELPRDHAWAELREAQALTAASVPHCGLAVAIDIGEAGDIHPRNKRDVGRRLALSALASTYGRPVVGSGPRFRAILPGDGRLRIQFDHADGLAFKGNPSRSFAIAGADRRFVWAEAVIDGDAVVVSSPAVPKPVAVRYAWDANPVACLYNGAGLPAVPFRSDDWPGVTRER